MLTLKPSDKPCFLCGSTEDTGEVRMKDRSFQGILCKRHVFEVMSKKKKENYGVPSAPSGGKN